MPALLLLSDAPHFTITYVNTAYLKLTRKKETDLVGKGIFETFPGNAGDLTSEPVSSLHQSLLKAVCTGGPQTMATQEYHMPVTGTDKFTTRYWNLETIRVAGNKGKAIIIIHSVLDVTEKISKQQKKQKSPVYEKTEESMGGKIRLESKKGKGSTFYFTLLK